MSHYNCSKPLQSQDKQKQKRSFSIFCPLCQGYITNSITTQCGHAFCSFCLKEYLLYSSKCPQCAAEVRERETSHNILLDKLVTEYLSKHLPHQFEEYKKTIELQKCYNKQKSVINLYAGDRVDVIDKNRVWHKAMVLSTILKDVQQRRVKLLRVRYQDNTIEDEILENSNTIAPLGYFTDRQLIPKNQKGLTVVSRKGKHYLYQK